MAYSLLYSTCCFIFLFYPPVAPPALLAIFTIGKPVDPRDSIKSLDLVLMSKLQAEAALEENKTLLGWKLDTRALLISFSFEKFKAWSIGIDMVTTKNNITIKELETVIECLWHATDVMSPAKHFMSCLRQLMYTAKHRRPINLWKEVKKDLRFHLKILKKAHEGTNMNLLTYRKVDKGYWSDMCPAGIGGYSTEGRACRFPIPKRLQFQATLNMLEHVASIIGP
jgi:hypothetical protein